MRALLPLALLFGLALPACEPCLGSGDNGVPDPQDNEFQLVMNNIVTGLTEVYVDGMLAGTVCSETEYATVGNFPVDTHTEILFHLDNGHRCYDSPNCDPNCGAQTCSGERVIDSRPFAGQIYCTGVKWLDP
ncbi:MAG: hypothetical protein JXR96_14500 [Deltaproteobacteria bacterium]|nr:hypothetical protein [Deltaproteobacteria bacterium]